MKKKVIKYCHDYVYLVIAVGKETFDSLGFKFTYPNGTDKVCKFYLGNIDEQNFLKENLDIPEEEFCADYYKVVCV